MCSFLSVRWRFFNVNLCSMFLMTSACFKEVNKVTGSIGPQSMRRVVTKGKRRLR